MSTCPTVFVVDDDLSVRRSLGRLLMSAGYEVVACASAEEFLALRLGSPLVPVDGRPDARHDRARSARSDQASRRRCSRYPEQRRRRRRYGGPRARNGAIRFLLKPFASKELFGALEEAIERDRTTMRSLRL